MAKQVKDTDYTKTIAKIRVFEKYMLSRQQLEKLCESRQLDEIYKALADASWHFAPEERDPAKVLSSEQQWIYEFLRESVMEEELLKLLLVKTDYQNCKSFLKQELAGGPIRPERFLEGGIIPVSVLVRSLTERERGPLPERMFEAFLRAREEYLEKQNPQRIDLILDQACAEEILAYAQAFGNPFILGYCRAQIDAVNLKTLLRIRKISEDPRRIRGVFLQGGTVKTEELEAQLALSPEECRAFLAGTDMGARLPDQLDSFFKEGALTELEKGLDDLLVERLRPARFIMFGPEPIFVYTKYMENEIRSVRIVLNGILSGLPPHSIKERMRLTYA